VSGMSAGIDGDKGQTPLLRVAFLVAEDTNLLDLAGPWEVFRDTALDEARSKRPFCVYTVGPSQVKMSGGLTVRPLCSIWNAPPADIIVVPAQSANKDNRTWLRTASAQARLTMSVCTGAFRLADAGLLDGLPATTHHAFHDEFAKLHPQVNLRRTARFIDTGAIATAAGLTAGIDLALHVVKRFLGAPVAERTCRYLEHQSRLWMTGGESE